MDFTSHLERIRRQYLDHYRGTLRNLRDKQTVCTAEVWFRPKPTPGQSGPTHPVCVDILAESPKREMFMVANSASAGPLMATMNVGVVPVKLYRPLWEDMSLWVRIADPDWTGLDDWKRKWMDESAAGEADEDGLHGVAHYLQPPVAEGGGFVLGLDLGSAPPAALLDLVQTLVQMGATEFELGQSDGTDLPADVLADLRKPEISMIDLNSLATRLIAMMPEVKKVESPSPDQIEFYGVNDKEARHLYLDNLYRLLQRVGIEARPVEINRFLRGQREMLVPRAAADISALRAIIKDNRFLANIRGISGKMPQMVVQPLAADLWIVAVWDEPNGMRFCNVDEVATYGLSPEQTIEIARKNVISHRLPVELTRENSLVIARTGDCYDASLILDDDWCQEMAKQVEGELLACIPSRSQVLIGGTGKPQALAEMRNAAQRIEIGGDHLISGSILIRKGRSWELVAQDSAPAAPPSPTSGLEKTGIPAPPTKKRRWWWFN